MVRSREDLYTELENLARSAPLVEYTGLVENGNRIFFKDFTAVDGLGNNHYALPIVNLLKKFEESGELKPEGTVVESTSGSTGIALAAACSRLEYSCEVVIPNGGELARVNAIRSYGARVHLTESTVYVNGFPPFLKRYLASHRDKKFLNHSQGQSAQSMNSITVSAFSTYVDDCLLQLTDLGIEVPSYFIGAVGNGSSLLGAVSSSIGDDTEIIAVEPFQSALAYDKIFSGRYTSIFNIDPGTLPRHMLPGMSFSIGGDAVPTPHLDAALPGLNDVVLVKGPKTKEQYSQFVSENSTFDDLLDWSTVPKFNDYGRSTRACLGVALDMCKRVENEVFLLWAYDSADRYDLDI